MTQLQLMSTKHAMLEPLSVDPPRLSEIGATLAGLTFPAPPLPIASTGSDPASSAINSTMPNLESLVSEGLPGMHAALTRTATSMVTAADIYASTDQMLGDTLTQTRLDFGPGPQTSRHA